MGTISRKIQFKLAIRSTSARIIWIYYKLDFCPGLFVYATDQNILQVVLLGLCWLSCLPVVWGFFTKEREQFKKIEVN